MKKFVFTTAAIAIIATASFGQAPKTDRQERKSLASDKQEQRAEQRKRSPLLLPFSAGNTESRRSPVLRAAQESKLLLDSIVTQTNPAIEDMGGNEKTTYVYDTSGRLILETFTYYDSNGQLEEERQTGYGYNAAGKLILETEAYYDGNGQLEREYQTGYDDRGNVILRINREGAYYGEKYEYAYDHHNWQILKVYSQLQDGQWVNYGNSKTVTSYTDNANSYVETILQYDCSIGTWLLSSKYENTYSGKRQLLPPNDGYDVPDAAQMGVGFPALPSVSKHYPENLLAESWYQDNDYDGIFNSGSKTEYTSVVNGIVREGKNYSLNINTGALEYTGSFKYDYALDAQGLLTSSKYYYNTAENSKWIFQGSTTYTYTKNDNGNVLSWTVTYSSNYAAEKTVYDTYDAQNRAVQASKYYYDFETQQFVKRISYERKFDNYGNQTLYYTTYWENGDWTGEEIDEYAYDAAGRETMYLNIRRNKDDEGNVYATGYKYEYAFDNNGNRTLYIYYNAYDEATDEFIPNDKDEYVYDANNNLILEIDYRYDTATQTFVPDYKDEYTYGDVWVEEVWDGSYNPLTMKEYTWTGDAWVLGREGKYDWEFDNAGNPLTTSISFKVDGQWMWYGTMTWYYSLHEVTVGISAPAAEDLRIWVSGGELWIEGATSKDGDAVHIFDIAGRETVTGNLRNGLSINISHLPKGVYIVKVGNQAVKFAK
jgi:hypothetical protein